MSWYKKSKLEKEVVVIKGNPKFIEGNDLADKFYEEIKSFLVDNGFTVSFDDGAPYTIPKEDVYAWIGHSRGIDRLEHAPKEVITIGVGYPEEGVINNPRDSVLKGDEPNKFHYDLTKDMKKEILKRLLYLDIL